MIESYNYWVRQYIFCVVLLWVQEYHSPSPDVDGSLRFTLEWSKGWRKPILLLLTPYARVHYLNITIKYRRFSHFISILASGTSGGALAALVAVNNINCDDALQFVIETANDRKFRRDLNSELKLLLHKIVPAEAVSNCNGRLYICVTKVWPNPKPYPTIISKFQSFDNLVNVVAASCFIPIYSNRKSLGENLWLLHNYWIYCI